MSLRHKNGRYELITPGRIAGVGRAVHADEVTIKEQTDELQAQIDAIEAGGITLTEVQVNDGTVAAPSITFTLDPDTGIYRIGTNNIGITTNGAKVLDISSTGLGVTGTTIISGVTTVSNVTDSTTKDTGSIITEGGIGVEKAIFAGTTINAGTALVSGTTLTAGTSLLVGTTSNLSGVVTFGAQNIYKGVTSITAFATGGQASATALTGEFNEITVCAAAGDSVKLPTPVLGNVISVKNAGANYADVFGQTGATIDGGSANIAVRLQPGITMEFKANSTTAWVSNNPASGTIGQGTDISTGVTLNAIKGLITTQAASAVAGAVNTFTVTNSFCQADSHVAVYVINYSGTFLTNGNPVVVCDNRTDGTFDIVIANTALINALNGTLVIGFEIKN